MLPPGALRLAGELGLQECIVFQLAGMHLEGDAAGGDQVATVLHPLLLGSAVEHGELEREIRGAPKVPLAQRDEEGNLLQAQWAEVAEFDFVEVEELSKEARGREGESALQIGGEDHELAGHWHRPLLVPGDPPLIGGFLQDDLRIDEGPEVLRLAEGFAPAAVCRHIAGRRRCARSRCRGGGRA